MIGLFLLSCLWCLCIKRPAVGDGCKEVYKKFLILRKVFFLRRFPEKQMKFFFKEKNRQELAF